MTEYRNISLVIIFLGLTVLLCVGGGFWLAHDDKTVPEFLVAVGSGAVGALAGILSKTSATPTTPQEVRVVESINDPVVIESAE